MMARPSPPFLILVVENTHVLGEPCSWKIYQRIPYKVYFWYRKGCTGRRQKLWQIMMGVVANIYQELSESRALIRSVFTYVNHLFSPPIL